MKTVNSESNLTYALSKIEHTLETCPGCAPVVATRVCALARIHRKLNELSCNRELTEREERKMVATAKKADELLAPYGLEMRNPWGLCNYALPAGDDHAASSRGIFLA